MAKETPTEIVRNEKGQFVKGVNNAVAGFNKHPENRSDGGWDKNMVASYQYRRFWNMERKEFVRIGKCWGIIGLDKDKDDPKDYEYFEHTMVEETAFRRVLASIESLSDMREITTRVEGQPTEHIEAKVENKFANLTDEELKAIARAEYGDK